MARSVWRSANVKLALLYSALFSVSVLVLVALLFYAVREHVEAQAHAHVEAETSQLVGDYQDDGMDELRHDIRERVEDSRGHRLNYSVVSADGRYIFDDLRGLPSEPGWYRYRMHDGTPLLVQVSLLDGGYRLIVGADLSVIRDLENAMRNRMLVLLAFVLLAAVGGGVWVSRRFMARVDRLGRTAEAIGQGKLDARVPVVGTGDDFDQLAGTINRMLERIEQLVGEVRHVSTAIAHDLRTPLARLRQKLEQLGEKEQSAAARELTDECLQDLDAALATFSALLRIAEIESGSRRAGFTHVDLGALLEQLGEAYAPVAAASRISLSTQIEAGVRVHGDRELLAQAVVNLIENALRHSGASKLQLSLSKARGAAVVRVGDNGCGIAAGDRAQVLKPFTRLDAARSNAGNGLGLSLVKAITELHDGTLELNDAFPGLVVTLRFPPELA